jgi:hypothetical protein
VVDGSGQVRSVWWCSVPFGKYLLGGSISLPAGSVRVRPDGSVYLLLCQHWDVVATRRLWNCAEGVNVPLRDRWMGPDRRFSRRSTFTALPDGTYTFCAQLPVGGYLDPCHLGPVPLQVSLPVVQKSSGIVVRMVADSLVDVRAQDPQHQCLAGPGGRSMGTGISGKPILSRACGGQRRCRVGL